MRYSDKSYHKMICLFLCGQKSCPTLWHPFLKVTYMSKAQRAPVGAINYLPKIQNGSFEDDEEVAHQVQGCSARFQQSLSLTLRCLCIKSIKDSN